MNTMIPIDVLFCAVDDGDPESDDGDAGEEELVHDPCRGGPQRFLLPACTRTHTYILIKTARETESIFVCFFKREKLSKLQIYI